MTTSARPDDARARATAALVARMLLARIRSDWQYRTSFLSLLVAQAVVTLLEFVTLVLILQVTPDLAGWDGWEVAFLYGMASVPFALSDLLISSLDRVANYVRTGNFDRILLRPVPAVLQIAAQEFELRRIGKLLPTSAVLVLAVPQVEVDWTAGRVLVLIVALVSGTVIYSALWIVSASFSFWFIGTGEATNAMTFGGQYANQYPLHLYRRWIRIALGWFIPLAFVAYVPSLFLLQAENPLGLPQWLVYTSAPVAGLSLLFSLAVWRLGINHYQGTGS